MALLLAVAAVAGGWFWVTRPSELDGYGNAISAVNPVGRTLSIDTTVAAGSPVNLRSFVPRIVENTADAAVVLVVCERNAGDTGVGSQVGGLDQSCTRVFPLETPVQLTLGFSTHQIVAQVTPRRPGRVHIAGYDVTYRQGIRSGTQHAGIDTTVTTG